MLLLGLASAALRTPPVLRARPVHLCASDAESQLRREVAQLRRRKSSEVKEATELEEQRAVLIEEEKKYAEEKQYISA